MNFIETAERKGYEIELDEETAPEETETEPEENDNDVLFGQGELPDYAESVAARNAANLPKIADIKKREAFEIVRTGNEPGGTGLLLIYNYTSGNVAGVYDEGGKFGSYLRSIGARPSDRSNWFWLSVEKLPELKKDCALFDIEIREEQQQATERTEAQPATLQETAKSEQVSARSPETKALITLEIDLTELLSIMQKLESVISFEIIEAKIKAFTASAK